MVKTRRHNNPKRPHPLPDSEFTEKLRKTVEELISRCQEGQVQDPVAVFDDCYELSTSSFDICPTCSNGFDYAARDPICLPCGHTVCRDCIGQIRQTSTRGVCPYDRKEFSTASDSLTVNFAIRSMIDSRTKIVKRLCKRHKKELIGFGSNGQELLCGVCLFEKKGQVCFQFTSEQARVRSGEKRGEVEAAVKELNMQRELWVHILAITDLTLDALKPIEEALETKPLTQLVLSLQQTFTQVGDRKKAQQDEVEKLLGAWDGMTFPEKLSVKLAVPKDVALATECMNQVTALLKVSR